MSKKKLVVPIFPNIPSESAGASEKSFDLIRDRIVEALGIRAKYLEMLAAAYLLHTGLLPQNCELVEQRHDDGMTTWFYREKESA